MSAPTATRVSRSDWRTRICKNLSVITSGGATSAATRVRGGLRTAMPALSVRRRTRFATRIAMPDENTVSSASTSDVQRLTVSPIGARSIALTGRRWTCA